MIHELTHAIKYTRLHEIGTSQNQITSQFSDQQSCYAIYHYENLNSTNVDTHGLTEKRGGAQ